MENNFWAYFAQPILGTFCPNFGQNLPKIVIWSIFAQKWLRIEIYSSVGLCLKVAYSEYDSSTEILVFLKFCDSVIRQNKSANLR